MSSRTSLELNRATRIAAAIARAGLVGWACYYFLPLFTANVLLGVNGVSGAYMGFSWLANGFMFFISLLIAWKYFHPLAEMAFFPVIAACGYGMTKFFVTGQIAMNFAGVIASGIFAGIAIFNLIFLIVMLVQNIKHELFVPAFVKSWHGNFFKVVLVGSLAWAGTTSWSYIGFSQVYTVSDPHQANFSISFWGAPSMGMDIAAYKTPAGIAEMNQYKALNATFFFTVNIDRITGGMNDYKSMLNEWAPYGVKLILNINPYTDNKPALEDSTSYYHAQQVNASIQALITWMKTLNSTVGHAFRGVSLDVEGAGGSQPASRFPVSREQYVLAVTSFQNALDEFTAQTGNTTYLIGMPNIIFDSLDGKNDHDLDIAQRTISSELNWSKYGYMTYMLDAAPSGSLYQFVYHCELGMQQWGTRFVPWVGWYYDVNLTRGETPQIDLPGVYQQTLEDVKIAKSVGVNEVAIAPVNNFLYSDHNATKIQKRLGDLVAIKNGFDSFNVPITQNMHIVDDPNLYWSNVVPDYFWSNINVVLDLLMGTPGNWFVILQASIIAAVIVIFIWWIKKKEF